QKHLGDEESTRDQRSEAREGRLRLGDLLSSAKIVTQSDLDLAKQVAGINGKPIGELLVVFGLVTPTTLEIALELQDMTNNGTISARQAAHALSRVVNHGVNIDVALQDLQPTKRTEESQRALLKFLYQVGAIDASDVRVLPPAALLSIEALTKELV